MYGFLPKNKILINEPYTNIEIEFSIEEITIEIYSYAKKFLKENYDIDFRIHFEIVEDIPDEDGYTSGMFVYKSGFIENVYIEVADRIELSRTFLETFQSKIVLNTIKHELIHYALFEKYKDGFDDDDDLFISECNRLNVN